MFPHKDSARWMLAGQANIIFQAHPGFHSPYAGTNSMLARGEYKTSLVGTLCMGYELNAKPRYETDVIFDEESAGGRGISEALGLAGFTNLDVVRNPQLGLVPLHGAGAAAPDDWLDGQGGRRAAHAVLHADEGSGAAH